MTNKTKSLNFNDRHLDNYVFRAIAEYTYDWESWHAPDGRLLWVNAAVERMTGYQSNDCLKMSDYPLALVVEEDRNKISEVFRDAKSGGSGNDVEFQLVHRDGSLRWAAVSWQPMFDGESRQHLGFRASIRDVTERNQLREELRLHNQHLEQLVQERTAKIAQLEEHRLRMEKLAALGQMAAGVAHEVNNPLAGIRNAFALIKNNFPSDDENYELLELIDSEIERISSITHQMYQLYRPVQQSAAKFDLRQTLDNVVILLQPIAVESGVQVTVSCEECVADDELGPTEAVVRKVELKQILLNVVRNAIQASPRGGIVNIECSTSAKRIRIVVADQGQELSQEVAAKMFEPFFSTKTGTRDGMGLGLSVSMSLAEAMGGTITVKTVEGKGTRVKVSLPRRSSSHE